MHNALLNILDESDLGRSPDYADRIVKTPRTRLLDLAASLSAATSMDDAPSDRGLYSQWSAISLSGGPSPCIGEDCRISNADQLARYVALYADRVYVNNWFSTFVLHPPANDRASLLRFYSSFLAVVSVIRHLRPLIEAGRIVPVTTPSSYCERCLPTSVFGEGADRRFKTHLRELKKRYLAEITATFRKDRGFYQVVARGPADIIEHEALAFDYDAVPSSLQHLPSAIKRVEAGAEVPLSLAVRRKLRLHEDFAAYLWQETMAEMAVTQVFDVPLVTQRVAHIQMLSALSNETTIEQRNSVIQRHLTTVVPFIKDVDLRDLLKLRSSEGEAFVRFRAAFNVAVQSARSGANLTERDAKAIYSDLLAPELERIDQQVKTSRRNLLRGIRDETAAWTAAISFGMYVGWLPDKIAAAASALGLVRVAASAVTAALGANRSDKRSESPLYFLWRVRNLAGGRRAT